MNPKYTAEQFLADLEEPYAWPGGYPRYFIMADGGVLSFKSAKEEKELIIENTRDHTNRDWCVVACDINWEDNDLYCDHSSEQIECAYPSDEDAPKPRFVAGFNQPGYMPDNDPAEFDNFDEAKRYILWWLNHAEEYAETDDAATDLCHFTRAINLESGPFSIQAPDGYIYWVVRDGFIENDK